MKEEHFAILRRHMVEVIGIYVDLAGDELGKSALDERVLTAMGLVPRHAFVPSPLAAHAYHNGPLPIGSDKTISQPFIVALMTDLLEPRQDDVVLEVGTGLGYQAAVLGQLVRRVWSVEIIEELAVEAAACLRRLGYDNIDIHIGDGSLGWGACALRQDHRLSGGQAGASGPVGAAQARRPMVLPIALAEDQKLTVVEKDVAGRAHVREVMSVRFGLLETVR
jgi:protein-L-isoaspartate(D-aspartate) O-methyltransferase